MNCNNLFYCITDTEYSFFVIRKPNKNSNEKQKQTHFQIFERNYV